jgi:hypothetical protein
VKIKTILFLITGRTDMAALNNWVLHFGVAPIKMVNFYGKVWCLVYIPDDGRDKKMKTHAIVSEWMDVKHTEPEPLIEERESYFDWHLNPDTRERYRTEYSKCCDAIVDNDCCTTCGKNVIE